MKPGIITIKYKSLQENSRFIKGHPFGKVMKIETCQANIGTKYENAIGNRGQKNLLSFTFEVDSLPWGEWKNKFVITHKGKNYLRINPFRVLNTEYIDIDSGISYTKDEMKPFLKPKKDARKQTEIGLTGKQQVKVRTPAIENIISINGKKPEEFLKEALV